MDLDDALARIDRARRKAAEIGVPMAIAVVDPGGHVVAVARMEGAAFVATDIAAGKAYTAAAVKIPTAMLQDGVNSHPAFAAAVANLTHGRFVAAAGGAPLFADGTLVGAIGVSGGMTAEQDSAVLEAGLGS